MSFVLRVFRVILAALFAFAPFLAPRPAHAGALNWVKKTITYAQFDAAATTDTVEVYKTKAREKIHAVVMVRDTDFAGTSITAYSVSIGKSGAVEKYLPNTDVFTGVSNGDANSIVAASNSVEASGVSVIATATSVGANLSAGTAGKITVLILVSTLPPGA